MRVPEPFIGENTEIAFVQDADGLMSVIPQTRKMNRPLQRYFDSEYGVLYEDGDLDRFEIGKHGSQKKIKMVVRRYLESWPDVDGSGMYLYSKTPGSGKTMISCLLAAALSRRYNLTSQAMTIIGLMNKVQAVFSDDSKSIESVMNPLKAVDILVLDEFGGEKHSEFREDVLYELINHRLNHGKPVFFTSNVEIDSLKYHPRIKSRIMEMTFQFAMPDMDMRVHVRAKKNQKLFESFNKNP